MSTEPPPASTPPPAPPPKAGAAAIAALIAGILATVTACFPPVSLVVLLVAVVLAAVALARPPRKLAAIAALVCAIAFVLNVAAAVFYFTVYRAADKKVQEIVAESSQGNYVKVYYYDLGAGKLFAASSNHLPPIDAPSGAKIEGRPAGVRAQVLGCGGCAEGMPRYIGYLETYTPERKQAMRDPASAFQHSGDAMDADEGHLVARPSLQGGWVPAGSDEGMRIVSESIRGCRDPKIFPMVCLPGPRD